MDIYSVYFGQLQKIQVCVDRYNNNKHETRYLIPALKVEFGCKKIEIKIESIT